ncbi:MAG: Cytoplasmic axial filament protein CafA and Ribonuclease, partial [Myxococcaceae bacterium]|nr:Cytoplasmic axial filament protein CafA and Ribonuclease [Myxococcaceae bacterium]
MSKNTLVISVDIRETRVALIEGGIIAELHLERKGHNNSSGTVGNVVLGKVTRVLPGLQAAFIDIGQERAAFLHVEDLIRPDDFDAYLAGGRKTAARDQEVGPTGDEELDAEAEAVIESAPPMPVGVGGGGLLAVPVSTPSLPDIEAGRDSSPDSDPDDIAQASGEDADADDQEITRTRFVTELERGSGESIPASPDSDDSGDDLELRSEEGEDDDELSPTSDERPTLDMSAEDRLTATSGEIDDPDSSPPPPPVILSTVEDDDVEGVRPTLRPRPKKEKSEHPIGDAIGEVIREVIVSAASEALPEFPDMPGFTIHDPNDPTPKAPPPPRAAGGGRGGDRGRGFGGGRGRGRGRGRGGEGGGGGGRGREGGGGGGQRESGA